MAAAGRDQSVEEWLEGVLERELKRTDEDIAWMDGDLSRLGEFEPYDRAEGEPEDEAPVRYEPGRGLGVAEPGGKAGRQEGCPKEPSPAKVKARPPETWSARSSPSTFPEDASSKVSGRRSLPECRSFWANRASRSS